MGYWQLYQNSSSCRKYLWARSYLRGNLVPDLSAAVTVCGISQRGEGEIPFPSERLFITDRKEGGKKGRFRGKPKVRH